MNTITVNEEKVMPAPTGQQMRFYASRNQILVDFQDYDDEQTMFRRLVRCCYGLKEIELYNAIMAVEV